MKTKDVINDSQQDFRISTYFVITRVQTINVYL